MHYRPRTQTLLVIATSIVVSWLASVAEAQSHRGARAGIQRGGTSAPHRGHRASARSTRPAPRQQVQQPRSPSRGSLVKPGGLGSAANVRPGVLSTAQCSPPDRSPWWPSSPKRTGICLSDVLSGALLSDGSRFLRAPRSPCSRSAPDLRRHTARGRGSTGQCRASSRSTTSARAGDTSIDRAR